MLIYIKLDSNIFMEGVMKKTNNDLVKEEKYFFKGQPVPRVTTIISSMIHEEYLVHWANYLGLIKRQLYDDVIQQAFDIGTITHERIEQLLHDSPYMDNEQIPVQSFWLWYSILKENNDVETIYTEKPMICELYGGTLDAVLKINGKYYLIDFKTSKHVTYKYFLQLAAYRKMLRDSECLNLDGVIILQLNKVVPSFNEYVMNFPEYSDFMDFYEQTFLSLVTAYTNVLKCQSMFKEYLLTIEDK